MTDVTKPTRAVVHIGMPKAGSTTLQRFLHTNRSRLADAGFVYHRVTPHHLEQPEYVIAALTRIGRQITQPRWNAIYKTGDPAACKQWETDLASAFQSAKGETWIISSEHLYTKLRDAQAIGSLHALLSEHFDHISYLLYIRRQDRYLESRYSQRLRDGYAQTMQEFLDSYKVPDFDRRVKVWQKGIGSAPLQVHTFEPETLRDGDLIKDFCTAIGLSDAGLERQQTANTSINAAQARALRSANARLGFLSRFGYPARALRWLVIRAASLRGSAHKLEVSPQQRKTILDTAAASNEALRARLFPKRASLFSMADLSARAALTALAALHIHGGLSHAMV